MLWECFVTSVRKKMGRYVTKVKAFWDEKEVKKSVTFLKDDCLRVVSNEDGVLPKTRAVFSSEGWVDVPFLKGQVRRKAN